MDRCWGKRKAQDHRRQWLLLQDRLNRAQLALESDPTLHANQEEISLVLELLNTLDSQRAMWVDKVIQARWISDGDRSTKLFHKYFKTLATAKSIPALLNEEGVTLTLWTDMAKFATSFFQGIFGKNDVEPQPRIQKQEEVLAHVSDRFTEEEKMALNAPFSLTKLGKRSG